MYTISKLFPFSASHALIDLPPDHQCGRFHGHNYIVKVVLESSGLDRRGFVRDYGELNTFKRWIDDTLDHRWLGYGTIGRVLGHEPESDVNTFMVRQTTKPALDFNPTAENMARYLFEFAATLYPEVQAVGVSETPRTWAYYAPKNLTLDTLDRAIAALPEPIRTDFRTALRRDHD